LRSAQRGEISSASGARALQADDLFQFVIDAAGMEHRVPRHEHRYIQLDVENAALHYRSKHGAAIASGLRYSVMASLDTFKNNQ
jgi:hypothetical protein